MPIDCRPEHRAAKAPEELYHVNPRVIASFELRDIKPDDVLCARCMIQYASEQNLNLQSDFLTRAEVLRREREADTRRRAFSRLLDFVENWNLLPDVGGRPPQLGGKHVCRVDAERLEPDELFVLDSKLVRTQLHLDLTTDSSRPRAIIEKKALCSRHLEDLTREIDRICQDNSLPPIVWKQGRSHHSLADLFRRGPQRGP